MTATSTRVLALTGGHKIDDQAFAGLLEQLAAQRNWVVTQACQPGGQRLMTPAARTQFDAVLLYDLPGLELRLGALPNPVGPELGIVDAVADLLEAGIGVVALHHALAGWPAWPGWAEALGGRFHYRPATLRNQTCQDSGYRHGSFRVCIADPIHPVTAGVGEFELDDELYCAPVFEDDVHPLVRLAQVPPVDEYHSALDAVLQRPQRATWQPTPPSDLLGWTTVAGRSPVVTLLPGDGGATFADAQFARLLGNAVDWVASPEAARAAAATPRLIDRTIVRQPIPVEVR